MVDDQSIELEAEVIESCRGDFKVQTDNGQIVKAKLSGKMKLRKINVVKGDRVKVEVSVYDTSRGRIIWRL